MLSELNRLSKGLKNTILHPQWIANRYHAISRRKLGELRSCEILDIGSGDSDHTMLLHSSNNTICLDYPITNQRYTNAPDIYGDACALPVADESVDVVLLLEVLEHIGDDSKAINSVKNALKRGGQLYLSLPFMYPIHDAPYDYKRFTIYGIRHILKENGFKISTETIHGNSLVTIMQLMNLSLMEIIRDVGKKNILTGLVALVLLYPICLLLNIIAWPLLYLRWNSAFCLGYFVIAERS
ncbi:MAG: class I SAM-dependent methyltransferase [Candidatus Scalindua sp.]